MTLAFCPPLDRLQLAGRHARKHFPPELPQFIKRYPAITVRIDGLENSFDSRETPLHFHRRRAEMAAMAGTLPDLCDEQPRYCGQRQLQNCSRKAAFIILPVDVRGISATKA